MANAALMNAHIRFEAALARCSARVLTTFDGSDVFFRKQRLKNLFGFFSAHASVYCFLSYFFPSRRRRGDSTSAQGFCGISPSYHHLFCAVKHLYTMGLRGESAIFYVARVWRCFLMFSHRIGFYGVPHDRDRDPVVQLLDFSFYAAFCVRLFEELKAREPTL